MADDSSGNPAAAEIAIIGGGCYGSFYVRQLERAREKAAVAYGRLLVVDHDPGCQMARELGERDDRRLVVADWGDFLDQWLSRQRDTGGPSAQDAIVPSPLMPHLMYEWLERRARARWPTRAVGIHPLDPPSGIPWQKRGADGTQYVSFAEWVCPVNCIEPELCPATRGRRSWSMPPAVLAVT